MQNFCVAMRRTRKDLFTERLGWTVLIPTIVAVLSLGTAAVLIGWSDTFGYSLVGILAFGGAVGYTSFVIQTGGRAGLLCPIRSVDYLGVISFLMLGVGYLVGVARLLDFLGV